MNMHKTSSPLVLTILNISFLIYLGLFVEAVLGTWQSVLISPKFMQIRTRLMAKHFSATNLYQHGNSLA